MSLFELGKKTESIITKTTGMSMSELSNLDFDQEISLVEQIHGSQPVFNYEKDARVMPRGSVYLSEGKYLHSAEVERALDRMYQTYAR